MDSSKKFGFSRDRLEDLNMIIGCDESFAQAKLLIGTNG